jgi:hypothetical protein
MSGQHPTQPPMKSVDTALKLSKMHSIQPPAYLRFVEPHICFGVMPGLGEAIPAFPLVNQ